MFYFISSILPDPLKTGGEIVLHRHLVERRDFGVTIVNIPPKKNRIFNLPLHTRFRSYFKAFSPFTEQWDLSGLSKLDKPTIVLTVAHDRQCFAAKAAAAYWQVPLVTIFHDWYPVGSGAHPKLLFWLNREFKQLYRASTLALCVSPQMLQALGRHKNAIVLPPIPSNSLSQAKSIGNTIPQLVYAGFCGGAYQYMLQQLINEVCNSEVQLRISGPHSSEFTTVSPKVDLMGYLEGAAFKQLFLDADVLLVLINFNPANTRHFSTHFPSKLVEYAGKQRLIAIWGPEYSTAVQWAKQNKAAYYFTKNDGVGFLKGMLAAYHNKQLRQTLVQNAANVYKEQFDPEIVHGLLVKKINELL